MGRVLLIVCGALAVAALSCLMQVLVPKALVWMMDAATSASAGVLPLESSRETRLAARG